MSNAISRESFQEPKNYLGVHFQQGRPILDADLNEAQTVLRSMVRRFAHDSAGDGSPNHGFAIEQLVPPHRRPTALDHWRKDPREYTAESVDYLLQYAFEQQGLFLTVPGSVLEDFESDDFAGSQGRVRTSHDRPYRGEGFLRVSGHTGTVTVSRRLDSPRDLSGFDVATFRYRLNRPVSGIIRFFLEDDDGNRTVWPCQTPLTFPADTWLAGVAAPLVNATFHILARWLPLARVGRPYQLSVGAYGGTAPVTWTLSGDDLPPGITITGYESEGSFHPAGISFEPTATGAFTVDLTVADAGGRSTTRSLPLTVVADDGQQYSGFDTNYYLSQNGNMIAVATPTGTAADLTAIRRYGFELYQADEPLVWDLDDLRLGGPDLRARYGENNFVIRGSEVTKNVRRTALVAMLRDENGSYPVLSSDALGQYTVPTALQERLDSELMRAARAADDAGRFHLAGLPCVLADDILYSDQADPNDPPLTPPPAGQVRRDVVYLDAWTEPVTYVQDPVIREVALGGPDTSTRERVRHRVRVAQGGRTPTGDGMGFGTLATEGAYTAAANRLYRVEIDGPGDIGAATFRWSHENASVIARVIEPLPPGSTVVTVEDASAFHPGDLILLRKEFGAERHEVSQVTGNEITLAAPTGAQLAQLPAAATPDFTTFSLADRPMVQRWHGFGVAIAADPADESVSASLPLDDGVRVRFGGHSMLAGDFWTFTTRYLPGDEPAGFDADTRVEPLHFARPHGVRHHYAPLAEFTRHGDAPDDAMITDIEDRRARLGGSTRTFELPPTAVVNDFPAYLGGVRLSASARRGEHLVIVSGTVDGPGQVNLTGSFYTDEMTDPEVSPATGLLLSRVSTFVVQNKFTRVTLTYTTSGPDFDRASSAGVPTSLQFFVRFAGGTDFGIADLTATVIERN
jgi:hypothetical protein